MLAMPRLPEGKVYPLNWQEIETIYNALSTIIYRRATVSAGSWFQAASPPPVDTGNDKSVKYNTLHGLWLPPVSSYGEYTLKIHI